MKPFILKRRTRSEAVAYLTTRWHEQAAQFPRMANYIPLAVYVAVNAPHARRYYVPNPEYVESSKCP